MQVQPYLTFNGRCEEAVEFYRKALGAEVEALMRFENSDKVMHTCVRIGESRVMASDAQCQGAASGFSGFSLTLSAADDVDAARRFTALADGGEVRMPLAKTFFASSFGVVADRFGVSWMILVPAHD
jgi:PhnB protein